MNKLLWEINWDKVETLEDVIDILKSFNPVYEGELNGKRFAPVKRFLVYSDSNNA